MFFKRPVLADEFSEEIIIQKLNNCLFELLVVELYFCVDIHAENYFHIVFVPTAFAGNTCAAFFFLAERNFLCVC